MSIVRPCIRPADVPECNFVSWRARTPLAQQSCKTSPLVQNSSCPTACSRSLDHARGFVAARQRLSVLGICGGQRSTGAGYRASVHRHQGAP